MGQGKNWKILFLIAAGLQLFLFPQFTEGSPVKNGPAKVEPLGNGISKITLTPKAVERLDVQTAKILEDKGRNAQSQKVIPYSAVLYDPQGNAWAYTSPERLVYVREPITIDYIKGDHAFLTDGPPVGTDVVTVGVIELYGAETGIGK